MYVYGTGSQWHQLFRYNTQTHVFYNQRGKVLDIKDNKDEEGQYVGTDDRKEGRSQQKWIIRYVDEMDKSATEGMGSRGMQINKPFYI